MGRQLRKQGNRVEVMKERLDCARKKRVKERRSSKAARKAKAKASRAEYFKKRRQQLKENPEAYAAAKERERQRWKQRVAQGKVKHIEDMTEREKRTVRKRRRLSAKKHYQKKKEMENQDERTPVSKQKKRANKKRKEARKATAAVVNTLKKQLKEVSILPSCIVFLLQFSSISNFLFTSTGITESREV